MPGLDMNRFGQPNMVSTNADENAPSICPPVDRQGDPHGPTSAPKKSLCAGMTAYRTTAGKNARGAGAATIRHTDDVQSQPVRGPHDRKSVSVDAAASRPSCCSVALAASAPWSMGDLRLAQRQATVCKRTPWPPSRRSRPDAAPAQCFDRRCRSAQGSIRFRYGISARLRA